MNFKNQDQLLDLVKKAVDKGILESQVAVFDADGTLWKEDANQLLLDYQIKQDKQAQKTDPNKLENPSRKNSGNFEDLLSDHYQKFHRHELCELFAKKQAGLSYAEFQSQAEKALDQTPLTVFPFQKELLVYLKKQNIKTVVITASIQWLVELAVKKYDLPVNQVLGCRTELDTREDLSSGKKEVFISDRIVRPSPGNSKGEVFLKEHTNTSCFLAAGNTFSDLPLLDMAYLPFVVHSAEKDNIIFPAEQKMRAKAIQEQWLIVEKEYDFI